MEGPTDDACEIALSLFGRYGRLENHFKNQEINKGSGIWQHELDSYDILLIERISIGSDQRRKGVGPIAHDDFAGDGSHHDTFGKDIMKLPACRNDKEFRSNWGDVGLTIVSDGRVKVSVLLLVLLGAMCCLFIRAEKEKLIGLLHATLIKSNMQFIYFVRNKFQVRQDALIHPFCWRVIHRALMTPHQQADQQAYYP